MKPFVTVSILYISLFFLILAQNVLALDEKKQCCHDVPSRFEKRSMSPSSVAGRAVEGMVLVPSGEFLMGTNDTETYEQERPAHKVKLDGFFIDKTEVTNEAFEKFVLATNYKTVAESKPDWEELKTQLPPGTQKPSDDLLVASSLVFQAPNHKVSTNDITQWWKWVAGASWQHPEGPKSSIKKRMTHPVVQVAYQDAVAFCQHQGKRLPTEAEWEYASRGGLEQKRFAWGDSFKVDGLYMANTFQGSFPDKNTKEDGFLTTSPVKSYKPNGYGLYDMIGNVWEWTSDWYDADFYKGLKEQTSTNPHGPQSTKDPEEPYSKKRVTKGGSFLCTIDYCSNYRPSARRGTAYDSGSSNIGFRCAKNQL
jgi:sulfatase modifying factor 1